MKKIITFLILLWPLSQMCHAQEVISSQGDTYSNDDASIDFTIGEVVIEALTTNELIITQGFHQVITIEEMVTELINESKLDIRINIYPNPATNYVILDMEHIGNFQYQFFDMNGRLILNEAFHDSKTNIDLIKIPEGIYQLLIMDNHNNLLKGYKITKN